jgi:hypothetical protein
MCCFGRAKTFRERDHGFAMIWDAAQNSSADSNDDDGGDEARGTQ